MRGREQLRWGLAAGAGALAAVSSLFLRNITPVVLLAIGFVLLLQTLLPA